MFTNDIDQMLRTAGLNSSQRRFCKAPPNKNIRLLAPAGAGKTFSLLWRCKCIHETSKAKGTPAPRFLLVAFTRAAKQELEMRLMQPEFEELKATVRTLNAWGWEQINKKGKELISTRRKRQNLVNHDLLSLIKKHPLIESGFRTNYGMLNNSVLVMDLIDYLKSMGFKHTMKKTEYKAHIKYLKTVGLLNALNEKYHELLRMEGLLEEEASIREKAILDFFDFWKQAVQTLEANNRYTLEDQKYWARMYFEDQIKTNNYTYGVAHYSHIMVDEFQDINPLDMELIKAACFYHGQGKASTALTIIGDDDQAIFGWRGTTPQYILDPEKYFAVPFSTFVLETNYRSPKQIVEVSNKLLSYNKMREPKEMRSVAKGRAVIKVERKKTVAAALNSTMKLAIDFVEKKNCKTVALISRRQVSLFPYQVLFSAQNTPYHVDADLDIFEGEAMQSLQNIIKIVYRARNDDVDDPIEAVLAICDKIDKYQIQNKERGQIKAWLEKQNVDSFYDALGALREYPRPIKNTEPEKMCAVIDKLVSMDSVYKFMQCAVEQLQGLEKDYNKREIDAHYKEPQFLRLTEIAKRYGADLKGFYRDIDKARKAGELSRIRSNDETGEGYQEAQEIPLHLVTATRSKGHEYDAVIILDADDSEWPNRLVSDMEEERRLFYVALSRAKKYLVFTINEEKEASRFLLEAGLI